MPYLDGPSRKEREQLKIYRWTARQAAELALCYLETFRQGCLSFQAQRQRIRTRCGCIA